MDFEKSARSKRRRKLDPTLELPTYSHWLQFYRMPPTETISLQELEELALCRLKVLKSVETVGIQHVKGSNDYKESLEAELKRLAKDGVMRGMIPSNRSDDDEDAVRRTIEERRRDHLSHFILRLAYCRTEELRRWFITQECDLFRYRFSRQSTDEAKEFLVFNNLNFSPISQEEKNALKDKLVHAQPNFTEAQLDKMEFYKVYFTEAIELVRSCKVFLRGGFAYVPHSDLSIIIINIFRTRLSQDLAIAARHLPGLEEEDRLLPLLSEISKHCSVGQDYGSTSKFNKPGNISADMLDSLSTTSFPLCMQHLHQSLRQQHHLRYAGRMQYGLFLKAAGLSLEQALMFWRAEFTRVMDSDKFEKQYAYNIRHNYGKEGKRADYTPYSCMKIIMNNAPSTGDHHGCPYRHWDTDILKQRLQALRITGVDCEEILDLTKQGHFQLACGRYFDAKHNSDTKFVPQHPNQYYETSTKLREAMMSEGVKQQAPTSSKAVLVQSSSKKPQPDGASTESFEVSAVRNVSNEAVDEFADDIPMDCMDDVVE